MTHTIPIYLANKKDYSWFIHEHTSKQMITLDSFFSIWHQTFVTMTWKHILQPKFPVHATATFSLWANSTDRHVQSNFRQEPQAFLFENLPQTICTSNYSTLKQMSIIEINELLGLGLGFFSGFAHVRFSDSSSSVLHSVSVPISWKQLHMGVARKKVITQSLLLTILYPYIFGKLSKSPLWKKKNVLNYLKDLDLSKLKKNLEKWTKTLNSETIVQRDCTGYSRSFILWITFLCPLEKFSGILGIKKRLNAACNFVCGTR